MVSGSTTRKSFQSEREGKKLFRHGEPTRCKIELFSPSVETSGKRDFSLKEVHSLPGGGGGSHLKMDGDARRKFGIKPLINMMRPICAWPELFLTPKREHSGDKCYYLHSNRLKPRKLYGGVFFISLRVTLRDTLTANPPGLATSGAWECRRC